MAHSQIKKIPRKAHQKPTKMLYDRLKYNLNVHFIFSPLDSYGPNLNVWMLLLSFYTIFILHIYKYIANYVHYVIWIDTHAHTRCRCRSSSLSLDYHFSFLCFILAFAVFNWWNQVHLFQMKIIDATFCLFIFFTVFAKKKTIYHLVEWYEMFLASPK